MRIIKKERSVHMNTLSNIWSLPKFKITKLTFIFTMVLTLGIAIPNFVHYIGGQFLGRLLLPLPFIVILSGMLFGWEIGLLSGIGIPLISYLISGMPPMILLKEMLLEVSIYGLLSGLLYRKLRVNVFVSILIALLMGKLSLFVLYHFLNKLPTIVFSSMTNTIPGLLLQIFILPFIIIKFEKVIYKEKL